MKSLKIICPNGHLGFAPLKVESFRLGVAAKPDYIAADSGSDDIGPVPLGTDTCASPAAWQEHDLEHMLLAARELDVPMIIGSAGDTGTNSRVDMYVEMIRRIAERHSLPPFRLGWFYSEVDREVVRAQIRGGSPIAGLDARPDLTEEELDATARVVAMAGSIPSSRCCRKNATSSSAAAVRTAQSSPRPRSTTAFRRRRPTTSARCSNAPRSAPSPMAPRRPCWARSPTTGSR